MIPVKSNTYSFNRYFAFSFIIIVLLFSLFFSIHSCKNDFEVIDEWKDRTVVYGILDQDDTTQYIRIQKAFLGNMSAYAMAQNPDSIYYSSEICDTCVKFLELNNGTLNRTIYLAKTTFSKDTGIFATGKHLLFKTTATLDPQYTYQLVIRNIKAKKTIFATTPLITAFAITEPKIGGKVSFYNQGKYLPVKVEWVTAPNSRLYQLTIRINYMESTQTNFAGAKSLFLDWAFPMLTTQGLSGGEIMRSDANGEDFYKFLASHIANSDSLYRKFIGLDFMIFTAGDELATYYSINQPSLGLVQEKPEYTNIKNDKGEDEIGIFSCRLTLSVSGKTLTFESCTELKSGSYTASLRFIEPALCD